jgi:hypothetical protein
MDMIRTYVLNGPGVDAQETFVVELIGESSDVSQSGVCRREVGRYTGDAILVRQSSTSPVAPA